MKRILCKILITFGLFLIGTEILAGEHKLTIPALGLDTFAAYSMQENSLEMEEIGLKFLMEIDTFRILSIGRDKIQKKSEFHLKGLFIFGLNSSSKQKYKLLSKENMDSFEIVRSTGNLLLFKQPLYFQVREIRHIYLQIRNKGESV
ncbi:MAG: hypothetical protein H7A25_07200 [Leptospiraceae bacterium]|nr:hypothetical protein [Leptospiraceae bacterium]MCP5499670.1 hypothetical protein [Leptospiraceae bacterium]